MWIFKCYTPSISGDGPVKKWYLSQEEAVKAKIDAKLEFLQNVQRKQWVRPDFDKIHGSDAIWEIRINAPNGKYRLLGYFGPNQLEFTLLTGFKKQRDSDTSNATKIAENRKKEIEQNETKTRKCDFF